MALASPRVTPHSAPEEHARRGRAQAALLLCLPFAGPTSAREVVRGVPSSGSCAKARGVAYETSVAPLSRGLERRVAEPGHDREQDEHGHDEAVEHEDAVRVAAHVAEEPLDRQEGAAERGERSDEKRAGPPLG